MSTYQAKEKYNVKNRIYLFIADEILNNLYQLKKNTHCIQKIHYFKINWNKECCPRHKVELHPSYRHVIGNQAWKIHTISSLLSKVEHRKMILWLEQWTRKLAILSWITISALPSMYDTDKMFFLLTYIKPEFIISSKTVITMRGNQLIWNTYFD